MDVTEAMDRELIIERAEEVRLWLLGLKLSNRAHAPLQRELGAIIADDPGSYINGQRPLAGLTVATFITEIHRPNGGAVGKVKRMSDSVLQELRSAIPAVRVPERVVTEVMSLADSHVHAETPDQRITPTPPVTDSAGTNGTLPAENTNGVVPQPTDDLVAPAPAVEAAPLEAPIAESQPVRRPRGRPKRVVTPDQNEAKASPPTPPSVALLDARSGTEKPKRPRGRPRRVVVPDPVEEVAVPVNDNVATVNSSHQPDEQPLPFSDNIPLPIAHEYDDPMLNQIRRLWPALHPHARRAVVMYVSELWSEASYPNEEILVVREGV